MEKLLRSLDPRLKIALGLLVALLTWMAGPFGVASYAVLLSCALLTARLLPGIRQALGGYALFLGLWTGIKLLTGAGQGLDLTENLAQAAGLAGRLYVLLVIGLFLSASSSPRSLGLAVSWYLRPLGRWTWQPSLALALMVHFLPLTWQTLAQVKSVVNLRCQGMPQHRKLALLAQASLRSLTQKTWDQTLALAARGFDGPEAWQVRMPWKAGEVVMTAGIAVVLAGLAMI